MQKKNDIQKLRNFNIPNFATNYLLCNFEINGN